MNELLSFLETNGIAYTRYDHEPLFTCEQAKVALAGAPGRGTKNLFLRDEKGKKHFLLVVSEDKQVDLKVLSKSLEVKPLSLASPDRLKTYLDLEPGSVTVLAVFSDPEGAVEVLIDESLSGADAIHCHPLVNTSTLAISWEGILKFLKLRGHPPRIISVPVRSVS